MGKKTLKLSNLTRDALEAIVEATFTGKKKTSDEDDGLSVGAEGSTPPDFDTSSINPKDYVPEMEYLTGGLERLAEHRMKWRW
jgi:hypothetical protein